MGKPTGFMEYKREDAPAYSVKERIKKTIEDRVRKQMPENVEEKEVKNTVDGLIKQFDNTSKIYFKD